MTPGTPVPDVTVVMVWLAQPFVPVNVNPPTSPLDTLVSVTVGRLVFVNVQAILEPAAVAAASKATAPVPRFGVNVPPVPSPVQVIDARVYPAGMLSVIVVAVAAAASVRAAPVTPVPDVKVVIVCAALKVLRDPSDGFARLGEWKHSG